MAREFATHVGEVQSVSGSTVSVRLRPGLSSLALVGGESYRIGQVGGLMRVPLGYTQLYGVCTQVGAAALPQTVVADSEIDGRWVTVNLIGESLGGRFERGVTQHPTFGDQVHLVTTGELAAIYESADLAAPLSIGTVAAGSGIEARVDLARLVSRHSVVVGSSGSGKSNLVALLLEAIGDQGYDSARVLVLDPHGEYSGAVGDAAARFSITPTGGGSTLRVPYWALPFDELLRVTLGDVNPMVETAIREEILLLKTKAAALLPLPPPPESLTADSPVPFSLKQLWLRLAEYEARTYTDQAKTTLTPRARDGDADALVAPKYAPHAIGAGAPYKGPRREIGRQLELLRSRLLDSRYEFLFDPGDGYTPDLDGRITNDLDRLVATWVGDERLITVLDLSGTPSEVLALVAGTVMRILYDALFWAADLPISGRRQPLLVVVEEAHLFVPDGRASAAQRIVAKIAKEGRKYGVGLMLVTQRPTELDTTALSQCGTMIALRLTNSADQSRVKATMPDDLAGLASLLPSLRTGEAIVTGEAMSIPTRVRLPTARRKPVGVDADLASGWRCAGSTQPDQYTEAIRRWRSLRHASATETDAPETPTTGGTNA